MMCLSSSACYLTNIWSESLESRRVLRSEGGITISTRDIIQIKLWNYFF
jgi:hypothetical protein